MSCVEVPGVNSSFTPMAFSPATSSGGMMPPPKTAMSSAPFSLRMDGRGHDLLGRLMQPGVDHLEAGVAQRPRDDLGAPVVAVEPGLRDDDANGTLGHHVPPSAARIFWTFATISSRLPGTSFQSKPLPSLT